MARSRIPTTIPAMAPVGKRDGDEEEVAGFMEVACCWAGDEMGTMCCWEFAIQEHWETEKLRRS
jgi:hypothetical protein